MYQMNNNNDPRYFQIVNGTSNCCLIYELRDRLKKLVVKWAPSHASMITRSVATFTNMV